VNDGIYRRLEGVVPDLFRRLWISVVDRVDRSERGQTTAEYALVLIAAAAIGGLVLAWATKSHAISGMFDKIVKRVTDMVT
jgi:Flp pilus assembly pilin Flp